MLLTVMPVETTRTALDVVDYYRCRWGAEIDHSCCAPSEVVHVPPLLGPVATIRDLPAATAVPYPLAA
jgi:hypothetical protein